MSSFNRDTNNHNFWINIDLTQNDALRHWELTYGFNDEIKEYIMDDEELARVEYDREEKILLMIFSAPIGKSTHNYYETVPIVFLIRNDKLFTFTNEKTAFIKPIMEKIMQDETLINPTLAVLRALFHLSDLFLPIIDEVNKERISLNRRLSQKVTNRHLSELSDLSIGLIYLTTSTRQNVTVLKSFKATEVYRTLNDEGKEELEDAVIEAKQASEMAALASEVIDQLSIQYNNVLNNNLNDLMKTLTLWSILIAVPNIITGFFGMNITLPLSELKYSWVLMIIVIILLSILVHFIVYKITKK